MQEFFILKGSTNPSLEMELIDDGRYSFQKSFMNKVLQDSNVTFSMVDVETNTPKISNAKANVVLADNDSCEEKYVLQYQWKDRDVKNSGIFKGFFEIKENDMFDKIDVTLVIIIVILILVVIGSWFALFKRKD